MWEDISCGCRAELGQVVSWGGWLRHEVVDLSWVE